MFEWCKTTRQQGDAGLGMAVGWFAANGRVVCLPLTDNQSYDLVVEENGAFKKVSVKTTTTKSAKGDYLVQIKSVRPNRTSSNIHNFDPSLCDYLFVVVGDGTSYLIPTTEISVKTELRLGEKYNRWRVA